MKKLQSMRGSFNKELRKVKASQTSGASPDEVHIPKLWYFKELGFLQDQDIPRSIRSVSSILDDLPFEGDDDEEEDCRMEESPRPETPGTSRSSTPHTGGALKRPLPKADALLEKIVKRMEDPVAAPEVQRLAAFGSDVAEKLRNMPPAMSSICQKLISDSIFYGEMGSLNVTSRILTDEMAGLSAPIEILYDEN